MLVQFRNEHKQQQQIIRRTKFEDKWFTKPKSLNMTTHLRHNNKVLYEKMEGFVIVAFVLIPHSVFGFFVFKWVGKILFLFQSEAT